MGRTDKRRENGFTLIELAISMMIVGILVAGGLGAYQVWQAEKNIETTKDNLDDMSFLVDGFRATNDRFPCPAPLEGPGRDADNYGTAIDLSKSPGDEDYNCAAAETPVACSNGFCVSDSNVTVSIDMDGDPSTYEATRPLRVLIGAVPFRDLFAPEESSYDAYGNRLLYAVTYELTRTDWRLYEPNSDPPVPWIGGGITIETSDGNGDKISLVSPDHAGEYIVISLGPDQIGGVNRQGVEIHPCNVSTLTEEEQQLLNNEGGSGTGLIYKKNCDMNPLAEFWADPYNTSGGSKSFDDMVSFEQPLATPLWATVEDSPTDIQTKKGGRIGGDYLFNWYTAGGAGQDDNYGGVETKLLIEGDIFVEGETHALGFCNHNSGDFSAEDCFRAENLMSEGIVCDPDNPAVMVGFDGDGTNAGVKCGQNVDFTCPFADVGENEAPRPQVLQQMENGTFKCVPPPCAATTMIMCNQNISIPARAHGEITPYYYTSNQPDIFLTMRVRYRCDSGDWKREKIGFCNCRSADKWDVGCGQCYLGREIKEREDDDVCTMNWSERVQAPTISDRSNCVMDNSLEGCGGGGTPDPGPELDPDPDPENENPPEWTDPYMPPTGGGID